MEQRVFDNESVAERRVFVTGGKTLIEGYASTFGTANIQREVTSGNWVTLTGGSKTADFVDTLDQVPAGTRLGIDVTGMTGLTVTVITEPPTR